MALEFLSEFYIPVVVTACLILGYLMKKSLAFIPNNYIPLLLTLFGSILGCIAYSSIGLAPIVYGALSGLASTGLHQAFTRVIEQKSDK